MDAAHSPAAGPLKLAVSLIGVLALAVALAAPSVQAGGTATAAKKCKKKHSAVSAKKKCKKKGGGGSASAPAPPAFPIKKPAPPPGPEPTNIDKVTLTWNTAPTAVDLDLHAWNSDGSHSGYNLMTDPVLDDDIPGGTHSADVGPQTTGSETYTDTMGSSHELTMAVCYQSSNGMPDPTIEYTLTIEYSDAADDVIPETGFDQGEHNQYDDGSATFYEPTAPCDGV
jgi:hypothetical protein